MSSYRISIVVAWLLVFVMQLVNMHNYRHWRAEATAAFAKSSTAQQECEATTRESRDAVVTCESAKALCDSLQESLKQARKAER